MTAATLHPACVVTDADLAVRAVGLGKMIDDKVILEDIGFELPHGGYVALLGANGAGKSTLLKILATLIRPSSGELTLLGTSARRAPAKIRAGIGLIGHESMLYRDLSPRENLVFFGKLYGVREPLRRADELLDFVELSARGDDPVRTFSRGMTQRVAIARALVHDPTLLLADEPFAGLDAPSCRSVERMLERLHGQGRTIVLANHDLEQSLRLAEHAIVLRRGRLVVSERTARLEPEAVMAEVTGA